MFGIVTKTWNPVTGCTHECVYCWARRLAETKLRHLERYRDGFKPRLNENEFRRRFSGGVVFVCDMGDLFCDGVPDAWIRRVIAHIARFPTTTFLLLTKNPARFRDFLGELPGNVILGATVETDRDDLAALVSRAPPPSARLNAMEALRWPAKLISIEPIMDFNLDNFAARLRRVEPVLVYVGYDNYGHRLPEPPLQKTAKLVEKLSQFTTTIVKTIRPAWHENRSPHPHNLTAAAPHPRRATPPAPPPRASQPSPAP